MFSADLSWTDPSVEKVGERRERKARERSSTAGSIKTTSSRSSISADRELWWTAGLKKARGLQSNLRRPSSTRSTDSQKLKRPVSKKLDVKVPDSLKDPTLQPPWTYATTLSPKLPSGAPLDLPVHEVPELEGDTSSRRTTSTEARFSRKYFILASVAGTKLTCRAEERRWEVQTPVRVDTIEEESQQRQEFSNFSDKSRGRANSVATERDDVISTPSYGWPSQERSHEDRPTSASMMLATSRRPCPVIVEGALSFEALKLHDAREDETVVEDSFKPIRSDARLCPPLSQWECLTPRCVPQVMQVAPKPAINKVAVAHSSTLELTRFQRFIRRMESAGPRIVLDRLKEEWQEGEEMDEEVSFETDAASYIG